MNNPKKFRKKPALALVLVGAGAVNPLGMIAVSTQELKPIRVVILPQPPENLNTAPHFSPVFRSIVFYMVNFQEFAVGFPATSTLRGSPSGISGKGCGAQLISVPLRLGEFVFTIFLVLPLHSFEVFFTFSGVRIASPVFGSTALFAVCGQSIRAGSDFSEQVGGESGFAGGATFVLNRHENNLTIQESQS